MAPTTQPASPTTQAPAPTPSKRREGRGPGSVLPASARRHNNSVRIGLATVRLGPFLMLIFIALALTALSPVFLTPRNIGNVGLAAAVVAILAIGQLFVIMTAGIDLSVGSLVALTSVTGALWIRDLDIVSGWLMIPTMVLTGALLGTISGLLFVKGRIPHPFLPTLAMLMIARGLSFLFSGGTPITGLPDSVRFIGQGSIGPLPVAVVLVAVIAIIGYIALNKLTWGGWVRAIGGSQEAARRVGVPVDKVLISVYAISGATAGIAAIIVAGQTNSAYPTAGLNLELSAIAAVIIGGASFFGGRGTIGGALVGALILGVIQNGLNLLNVESAWQYLALGIVIILAVEMDVLRGYLEKRLRVIRTEESESHS